MNISVLINDAGISGSVVSRSLSEVLVYKGLVVAPKSKHESGWKRHLDNNLAEGASWNFMVGLVKDLHLITRHRSCDGTWESREDSLPIIKICQISTNRPSSLSLPPGIVDDNMRKMLVDPENGVRVASLTDEAVSLNTGG